MVASDDIILQLGDRLRVIVPTGRMHDVAAYLGDSERGMSDINPIGLALGLVLGVLLGKVHVPLPGGGFEIGEAAGTLITGLIFGRLGRVGPLITGLPRTAASALSRTRKARFREVYRERPMMLMMVMATSSSSNVNPRWSVFILRPPYIPGSKA
jgi:uncharacterized transporter YbjL